MDEDPENEIGSEDDFLDEEYYYEEEEEEEETDDEVSRHQMTFSPHLPTIFEI